LRERIIIILSATGTRELVKFRLVPVARENH
jgi:hypothetical protein